MIYLLYICHLISNKINIISCTFRALCKKNSSENVFHILNYRFTCKSDAIDMDTEESKIHFTTYNTQA